MSPTWDARASARAEKRARTHQNRTETTSSRIDWIRDFNACFRALLVMFRFDFVGMRVHACPLGWREGGGSRRPRLCAGEAAKHFRDRTVDVCHAKEGMNLFK